MRDRQGRLAGLVDRRLRVINTRPFGRPEAAFYEFVAAKAVREVVEPILSEALRLAPPGRVLDVGCGGGALSQALAADGRRVVAADPSIPQTRRARRRGLPPLVARADALPLADRSLAAVVSSCAVKHWPSLLDGISECARLLQPGGVLAVVEIDGGLEGDLLRFAALTRIPRGLRWLYPTLARHSFLPTSPTADELVAAFERAGFARISHRRIDGQPFVVLIGRVPG